MSTETREPNASEVTFNTIRDWAERAMETTAEARQGTAPSGYRQAAYDVLAILEKHGAPPGEPVNFSFLDGS